MDLLWEKKRSREDTKEKQQNGPNDIFIPKAAVFQQRSSNLLRPYENQNLGAPWMTTDKLFLVKSLKLITSQTFEVCLDSFNLDCF